MNVSALIGELRFYPSGLANINDYGSTPTDRGGFYPVQSGPLVATLTSGNVPANYASVGKSANGFDLAGGLYSSSVAPADATVISPLTSLLTGTNTEAKLEQQLGINGSLFALSTDRPIKTFSPSLASASSDATETADAERLAAHHLRILAVSASLAYLGGFGADPSGIKQYDRTTLRAYLDTAPAQFIYTNAAMSALLRTKSFAGQSPQPVYSDEVISAAAHLINAYSSAIGVRISTRQAAARWHMGIWGYLVPRITRLLQANSSAAANEALGVGNQQIIDATARFNDQHAISAADTFFPQPDFYVIQRGGTYLVPAIDAGSNGDGPLNSNDFALRASATQGIGGGATLTTVTALSVPAANAPEVSASLRTDGSVLITPSASFTGVTYFDYTVRLNYDGDTKQGRVWVIVF